MRPHPGNHRWHHEPATDGESDSLAQQLSVEDYRAVVEKLAT